MELKESFHVFVCGVKLHKDLNCGLEDEEEEEEKGGSTHISTKIITQSRKSKQTSD